MIDDKNLKAELITNINSYIADIEINEKKTAKQVILLRLLYTIRDYGILPWNYVHGVKRGIALNYVSEKTYRGINRFLIRMTSPYFGGEFLTINQLMKYNKQNNTKYFVKKGSKGVPIMYYTVSRKDVILSTDELKALIPIGPIKVNGEGYYKNKDWGVFYKDSKGDLIKIKRVYRYYTVFNIMDIADEAGLTLPSKVGDSIVVVNADAQQLIDEYVTREDIELNLTSMGGDCFFRDGVVGVCRDSVNVPPQSYFDTVAKYYRVIFHELGHSTGTKARLNRKCYQDYILNKEARGKEELIAELTACLLADECCLPDSDSEEQTSIAYILNWSKWLKDNFNEFLSAFYDAERACQLIYPDINGDVPEEKVDEPLDISMGEVIDD